MTRRLATSLAAGLVLAACGPSVATDGSSDAGTTADAGCEEPPLVGDYPADVGAVIQGKCQPCHSDPPSGGAHFPLVRYEDSQEPFTSSMRRWQRMAQVVEPDGVPHMPHAGAPQLTDAELATLRQWFAACAPPVPEGTGSDLGE